MTQTQNDPKIGERTAKEKVAVHHLLGCLGTALFIIILIVALLIWELKYKICTLFASPK